MEYCLICIYVFFHAIVSSCNIVVLFVSKKLTRSHWRSCFPFFNTTALFCIFYFICYNYWQFIHLNTPQNYNSSWTSLRVKNYFDTFSDLIPQTALLRYHVSRNTLHCPGNPLITGSFKMIDTRRYEKLSTMWNHQNVV